MKHELRAYLASFEFDYALTAALNRDIGFDCARRKLRDWHAHLDRELLGPKWAGAQADKRSFFWAFPEHIKSNLHYHLLVKLSDDGLKRIFEDVASEIWSDIVPGGDLRIEAIWDATGADLYATKAMHWPDALENYIVSTEFIRSH